jgi:hypothetical protein
MTGSGQPEPSVEQLVALKGSAITVADLLKVFGVRIRNHRTVALIADALVVHDAVLRHLRTPYADAAGAGRADR